MSPKEVGEKLVAFCREGKNLESVNTLYADDVESIEAAPMPTTGERTMKGIEAVRAKNQWWLDNHEVHEASIEGPWPHGDDKFAVRFAFDLTQKPTGQRMKMNEIGVFTLRDGKVAREEYFYDMG